MADFQAAQWLRAAGQYNGALVKLGAGQQTQYIGGSFPKPQELLAELAICHLALHQFESIEADWRRIQNSDCGPGCPEMDLIRLIRALGRVHTDLALKEAWKDSKEIVHRHVHGKNVSDLSTVGIAILCYFGVIELQTMRFLDVEPPDISPSEEFWDALRLRLTSEGHMPELMILHTTQAYTRHQASQTRALQDTLKTLKAGQRDIEIHVRLILASAHEYNGDIELARQQLAVVQQLSPTKANPECQLLAEFLKSKHETCHHYSELSKGRDLLERCLQANNFQLSAAVESWLADKEIEFCKFDAYASATTRLLEKSHLSPLPMNSNSSAQVQGHTQGLQPKYSAHKFWGWYMNRVGTDMKIYERSGLAMTCCERFLMTKPHCSIPEMRYTLMTVMAECYELKGVHSQVLHWRYKASEVAQDVDDDDVKHEAESALQLALADDSIKILDDPYGIQQAAWTAASKNDLEYAFLEAQERSDWQRQFVYTWRLLEKEVSDEVRHGQRPTGAQWLPRLRESLTHLDQEKQSFEEPRIRFTMAHAIFEAQDYEGSIDALAEVAQACRAVGNFETASRALFTISRAFLELYVSRGDLDYWDKAEARLAECRTLAENHAGSDMVACCHTLSAVLWHSRKADGPAVLERALKDLDDAQRIWTSQISASMAHQDLKALLAQYAISGRNAHTPYSVYGLAVDICSRIGRHEVGFQWASTGKAQAFWSNLKQENVPSKQADEPSASSLEHYSVPDIDEPATFVHWVFNGDEVLMCTYNNAGAGEYNTFTLEISKTDVEGWYEGLVAARDNLSDPDAAAETLSELEALCRPILESNVANSGDILVLCPTGILFKIPLHAIPLSDGATLIELYPIAYTHSFSVTKECLSRCKIPTESLSSSPPRPLIVANATLDTPVGEVVAHSLAHHLQLSSDPVTARVLTGNAATVPAFLDLAPSANLVHIHTHVSPSHHPLSAALLFHPDSSSTDRLAARDVFFRLDLHTTHPLVVLIGCGSGVEKLDAGDEPLGLVSAFLHSGAGAVVGTMWPIHDALSGGEFTRGFYGLDSDTGDGERASKGASGPGRNGRDGREGAQETLDLARRVQRAVLRIKGREETRAPYFWAGFVVHGNWQLRISEAGQERS